MNHFRVLPRDLFNDAKLLKCLGFLTLRIHDNAIQGLRFEHDGEPFDIRLSESGNLWVTNLHFYLGMTDQPVHFFTVYNSMTDFPLQYWFDDDDTGFVFDDEGGFMDGGFSRGFLDFLKTEA